MTGDTAAVPDPSRSPALPCHLRSLHRARPAKGPCRTRNDLGRTRWQRPPRRRIGCCRVGYERSKALRVMRAVYLRPGQPASHPLDSGALCSCPAVPIADPPGTSSGRLSGAKILPGPVTCGDVTVGHDGQPCPCACST